MFCPKCGAAEQSSETYCRKCGQYLPDFDKIESKETPVEQNLLINSTFSIMTAVASLSLAITLYAMFIGREGTPWILYVVFGFLIAITAWQVQTFIRTRMLRKQFEKLKPKRDGIAISEEPLKSADSSRLLDAADFENVVPASVTDRTTRDLSPRSPQSKQ
jgi:hypothetical protein